MSTTEVAKQRVILLKPRLDVTFKKGDVPDYRTPLSPIRQHWHRFCERLKAEHTRVGHFVYEVEKPLWQFTPEEVKNLVEFLSKDGRVIRVYVPHRDRTDFPLPGLPAFYYMQTVFPECFTIDSHGWGASMSIAPIMPIGDENDPVLDKMIWRAKHNISKFEQPPTRGPMGSGYGLFVCQIPHDETIKKHSTVSVAEALRATLEATVGRFPVMVKGHPVNPGAMEPLREITNQYGHAVWVGDRSIHDMLAPAACVFLVNSGAGVEALIHNKPVYAFGRSEYESVVVNVRPDNLTDHLSKKVDVSKTDYRRWLSAFYSVLYDSSEASTFFKVHRL